jgi:drug/metabolite transporter (DMT)-like permease
MRRDIPRPLVGIGLKILSVFVFVAMMSLLKLVSDQVPPGQMAFSRAFFALPVITLWMVYAGELRTGLKVASPLNHLWRGLVGTAGMALNFSALGLLPLPDFTVIGYTAPLLVVVLSAMFLGEDVRVFRLSCVLFGFVGVIIVLMPRLSVEAVAEVDGRLGVVLALLGATTVALSQVFVRKLVNTETMVSIVFYFSLTSAALSLVTLPFGWVWPTVGQAAVLIGSGLLGGIGQILLTSSYREADVSLIAPFEYASILMALVVGYVVFDEVASAWTLWGSAIIVLAGVAIIWREHRLGIDRAKSRSANTL